MIGNKNFLIWNKETGKFEEFTPYKTICVETEEDYIEIKTAVNKQKAMDVLHSKELFYTAGIYDHYKTVHHCPGCNRAVEPGDTYCRKCGQKLNWNTEA